MAVQEKVVVFALEKLAAGIVGFEAEALDTPASAGHEIAGVAVEQAFVMMVVSGEYSRDTVFEAEGGQDQLNFLISTVIAAAKRRFMEHNYAGQIRLGFKFCDQPLILLRAGQEGKVGIQKDEVEAVVHSAIIGTLEAEHSGKELQGVIVVSPGRQQGYSRERLAEFKIPLITSLIASMAQVASVDDEIGLVGADGTGQGFLDLGLGLGVAPDSQERRQAGGKQKQQQGKD